jgi:hypothetical protein
MAGSFQNRKFFIAYPDQFEIQSAWDVAVANADIDARHPQVTPTYPTSQVTREKTPDCSGEYFIAEDLTSRLKRLRFGFNPNAQMLAGWLAMAYGTAASPTGTPADETQTITISATGGTFTISFSFEGLSGTTEAIAFDATAAVVQSALNAIRSVKQGTQNAANIAVSGSAGGPYTLTFQNKLAKANVPLVTTNAASLTGGAGTAVVAAGTAGANKLHAISRSTSDQPPQTSLIYGFEGDSDNPQKIKNVVVNEIAVSGTARGRVLVELDLIATWPFSAGVYSIPDCINFSPITTKDVRLLINSSYYVDALREFRFVYSNNIITGDDAFPFDDIDAIRLEKGDRTSMFNFTIFGSKGDTLYTLAETEPEEDISLHIGRPGDRVSIYAPSAKLKLEDTDTTFIGDANRSAISYMAEPFLDEGLSGTPDYIEANLDQTVQYLLT